MPSVLIIGDAADTLEAVGRVLHEAGFEVAWARTGRDGIELARRRTIDLVLTAFPADGADLYVLLNAVMSVVRPPLACSRSAGAGSVNRLNHQAIDAVQLIEERYGDSGLTVRFVARDLGISTEHLCRLLKRHTGCTFVSILRGARVRAARQLLRTTSLSMKQIADRVGFSSASQFDRDFKTVCGIPPTEYRISGGRRSQRVAPR